MTAARGSAASVISGSHVSHYTVGERLGAGGMGDVYRARDTRLDRDVALKFLRRATDSPSERARMLREARAASALRSSSIAAIFDIGEHDSVPFIVMELVDGEPLSARIARGTLPIDEVVSIGSEVADALDEAHANGIIHRDIKSANVMIDSRRRVKLVDFGLAKFLQGREREQLAVTGELETAAGVVMGTFAYMSPEQVRGRPLDARTDLFSLGVVLYEMLAGRLPFEGATVTEVADRILNHEPPALARFNYEIPERLDAIVRKAMTKDPALRYQSARELHVDLKRVAIDMERQPSQAVRSDTRAQASRDCADECAEPARPSSGSTSIVPALAVMTFSNITREPTDDWIGMGIAETVTADLKKVPGVTVIGRTQVFDAIKHLSGPSLARIEESLAIDIGRRLGATWIVGGGYQRLGSMIRITAECADVRTGELVRSVKVDGKVDDIFALQDRIVRELSEGLVSQRPSDLEAIARRDTQSLAAWEAFSRGMVNLRTATRESLERAVVRFEQALGHDPDYASAWALLGTTHMLRGNFLSQPHLLDEAVVAFRRALAIDGNNTYGLSGLGGVSLSLGRPDEAIGLLTRALEIEPANVLARGTLARAYWIGKGLFDEAIAVLTRALAQNADAGYIRQQLALLLTLKGELPRAAEEAERAVALQESLKSGTEGVQLIGSYVRLGYVRYRQGRYGEAITLYERERAFLKTHDHALAERVAIEIAQKLSAAWWRSDDRARADEAFGEAVSAFEARRARGADDGFTKYYVASLYALRGDEGTALRLLGEAIAAQPALSRARARIDPDFDPIRQSPAFTTLLEAR